MSSFSCEPDERNQASVKAPLTNMPDPGEELAEESMPVATKEKKPAAGGILRPFKIRNFTLLFSGQTVSTIGDALYAVALPWLILNNGGSAQELGIVLAAYGIPRAGSTLLGGWLSDRLRPRRLMLIADTVRAGLLGILAALALWGHPSVFQLCAIAVPLGALGGAFMPASMSILPDILSDDYLQAGNSLNLASLQGAYLVGSAIAGVVVAAFTAGTGLAIDAATFVVSAVSLAMMRAASLITPSKREEEVDAETSSASAEEQDAQVGGQSFGHFLRTSWLIQAILLIATVGGFCWGGLLEVALPALVHGPMHGSASGYGAILAACTGGALAGSIFAGMLGKLNHKGLIMLGDGLLMAVSMALVPVGGVFGAMVWMLIAGAVNSITNVQLFTIIQLIVPRHLLGRVMGVLMFGMYPISAALVGVLSNHFGPAILFPCSALLFGLVILLGFTQKALREI